ncbi:hypothetical protein FQA39_LY01420 [Lamprigera yunnana]|nr:hypothetical protein FQA39_LY01420 [Lamprigera yunnana]
MSAEKVLHFIQATHFWFGCYYDWYYVNVPAEVHPMGSTYGATKKLKFLTYWNALLQATFFTICLLNNFIGSTEVHPKSKPFIRKLRDTILASLAFPLAFFVGITFWAIYAIDRELVFPKALDAFFPAWLNHIMHTNIMIFIVLQMYLSYHEYPSRKQCVTILVSFMICYLIWVHIIHAYSGIWVYPILEVLNLPMRVVFFVSLLGLGVAIYILGEKLNKAIWGTLHMYKDLLNHNCSSFLRLFVCSVFIPLCSEHVPTAIPACRGLCEEVKKDCVSSLQQINFAWPVELDCNKFPEPPNLCMQQPSEDDLKDVSSEQFHSFRSTTTQLCPSNSVPGSDRCLRKCNANDTYTTSDRSIYNAWGTFWTLTSLIVTTFALQTFFTQPKRFRWPARPILYLSFCGFMKAVVYLIRWIAGPFICLGVVLLEKPTDSLGCTSVALMLVYLDVATTVWWCVFSFVWYLSAAKEWSTEALEKISTKLHTFVWTTSTIPVVFILISRNIHLNELTGFCEISSVALKPSKRRTASPLTADFNFPAPISDLATADIELVHELPGPSSSTADFNFPAPISDLATADMELVHELPGPSSSTADFNFPAAISDLATADMELVHELPGPSSTSTVPSPFKKHFFMYRRNFWRRLCDLLETENGKEGESRKAEVRASQRKKAEKDALMEQKKLEREDRKRRKSQDTQAKKTRRKLCYPSDSSVKVSSAESDIDDEETDEDDSDSKLIPPKKVNGEFVIVRYDGRHRMSCGGGDGGVGSAALRAAAGVGNIAECARLLGSLKSVRFSRDELGRSALHLAASAGHGSVVRLLLSVAAPREVDSPDGAGCTALQRAASDGHEEVVRLLLARSADVDRQDNIHGNCAIHEAAWKGYSRTVSLLTTASANLTKTNAGGFTALHLCCQNGHNQSCRELLLAGSNSDLQNNYGDTALHTSARYGHAGVTRILISAKCRVSEQNKNGDTALHIAAAMGRRKLTRILLEAGCDRALRNKQNETARDIALRKDLNEILAILDDCANKKDKKAKNKKKSKSKVRFDGKSPVTGEPLAKSKNWSPYGCHYYPDPGAFPSPRLDTLPDEPLKRGEQYYLDLAGNICKGPVGVGYTCYCAPLFRHLEARLEKDKRELQKAQTRLGQRVAGLEQKLNRGIPGRRSERVINIKDTQPLMMSRSRSLEMLDKIEESTSLQATRSMNELEQQDENLRPSVKEIVAKIQQQQVMDSLVRTPGESESSDEEDAPLRMVQHCGPMGSSNLVFSQPDSNPNYENVPSGPPRSRMGVYSPTLMDSKTRCIEPNVRVQESCVRMNPNTRIYTSSARIPMGFNDMEVRSYEPTTKYYDPSVNTRFAKLRMLDNAKQSYEDNSRMLDSNKMFESTAKMLQNPHNVIDRDNNDSGYSTKVYGSSKGNSPCLSGQVDNDCLGASSSLV